MVDVGSCAVFSNPLNVYLVIIGAIGFLLNIFPLYVIFKVQARSRRVGRDVLLAALCLVDILTVIVPLSIYLVIQTACSLSRPSNRPWICEMFYLMFIWFKLSAMFLITVLNYSSYLGLNVNGQYSDQRPSLGDRLTNSFHRSNTRAKRNDEHGKSVIVIANLAIGVGLVAFAISSLPYIGLGPTGANRTNSTLVDLCHIEIISFPLKGKEYTFLFAVLMSSAACFIVHLSHSVLSCLSCCFWRENLQEANNVQIVNKVSSQGQDMVVNMQQITDSYARMTFGLGICFFATWIPLMLTMGVLMSSGTLGSDIQEYSIVLAFTNLLVDPVIYAAFIAEYRQGYSDLVMNIFDFFKRCCIPNSG